MKEEWMSEKKWMEEEWMSGKKWMDKWRSADS